MRRASGSVRRRASPCCSSVFNRSESKLVLIPGRPSCRSVKRFGPVSNSRMMSSVQRSPIRSSANASAQNWL